MTLPDGRSLKPSVARVDNKEMSRAFGLPLVLVTVVLGGILLVTQMRSNGPSAPAVRQVETRAQDAVAGVNFSAADTALTAWFAEHGTYAGATVDPSFGVSLVRTDASSYCLQAGTGAAVQHDVGPSGVAQPGVC